MINNGAEHPNLATVARVGKVINYCWADQPLCSSARQVSSNGLYYADSSHDQSLDTTLPTEIGSPQLAAACPDSAIFKDWQQDQQRLARTGSPSTQVECHRLAAAGSENAVHEDWVEFLAEIHAEWIEDQRRLIALAHEGQTVV